MPKPTPLKRAFFESPRTQREVAMEIKVDPAHLSRIVNGLHTDELTEQKIAAALGRNVADLFPSEPRSEAA